MPDTTCELVSVGNNGPWPVLRCTQCGIVVEVRDGSDQTHVVAILPPCGSVARAMGGQDEALVHVGAERLGVSWSEATRYALALAKWTAAGFPTRHQKEVDRILYDFCQPCDRYRNGRCGVCGCRVNDGPAIANKIRMATEDCPLGKWPRTSIRQGS